MEDTEINKFFQLVLLTPMLCSNDLYRSTNDLLEQDCLRLEVCWTPPEAANTLFVSPSRIAKAISVPL